MGRMGGRTRRSSFSEFEGVLFKIRIQTSFEVFEVLLKGTNPTQPPTSSDILPKLAD